METHSDTSSESTDTNPDANSDTATPINRIERRKIEFRDNITRAAMKLFEEQGIVETSVAAIIKEADIAHKTFFNHFPTKDHLLRYIAGSYSDKAYDVFRQGIAKYDG